MKRRSPLRIPHTHGKEGKYSRGKEGNKTF